MHEFDYVMIFTILYGNHRGQRSEFFYQIWSKDYVRGVKTLRNQTYAIMNRENFYNYDMYRSANQTKGQHIIKTKLRESA